MASQNNLVLRLTFLMTIVVLISKSPTAYAAKDVSLAAEETAPAQAPTQPYQFVKEFCNTLTIDQEFCMMVLASNPRSASAKTYVDLIYISVDLAVKYANDTEEYMVSMLNNTAVKVEYLPALIQCISDYNQSQDDLRSITREVKDDPTQASNDAIRASEQLEHCEQTLISSNVEDHSLAAKHKFARSSVRLCMEIAFNIS